MQYISLWESHPDEPQFRSKAQDPAPVGYVEMVSPSDFPVRFAQVKEGLYRGGIVYSHQLETLYSIGVRHIISLIPWYKLDSEREMTQYLGPTITRRELTLEKMGVVADKIQELLGRDNGFIYVHCQNDLFERAWLYEPTEKDMINGEAHIR